MTNELTGLNMSFNMSNISFVKETLPLCNNLDENMDIFKTLFVVSTFDICESAAKKTVC